MTVLATAREEPRKEELRLRLFVSGATPRSLRAVAMVRRLCEAYCPGGYTLEVIDIYRDPAAVSRYPVVAVPSLMKLAPVPKCLFIGDVTDIAPLAAELGLTAPAIAESPPHA